MKMMMMQQHLHMQRQPWTRLQRLCTPPGGASPALLQLLPSRPRSSPASLAIRASSSVSSSGSGSGASPSSGRNLPWLIVGLGNPGSKFEGTRHNIGFEMIDAISEAEDIPLRTIQHKALLGKGYIGSTPVLLAKPQTYMNLSGESIGPISTYYKIPRERVLAIYDDLDLEFAVLKMLPKGGHGGHNGMRSLIEHFGGKQDFPRLRFGVGRPLGSMAPSAYVLQKFSPKEREELNATLQRGVEGVRLLTTEGLQKTVSTWNLHRRSRMDMIK
ncbi:hypothetical protein KC19_4G244500 [Ceratodon purpureus]|uniref:peptidyl-tRNA hydrolase n=1 Tax=Ceratodon purpureus TaxID=3225 RepID=A0A8T0IEP5_CERPU|nr:hypothetical protein KC19_4G244500 [Ceratodon purpureus]